MLCFLDCVSENNGWFVGKFVDEVNKVGVFFVVRDEIVVLDEGWDGLVFVGVDVYMNGVF